MAADQHPEWTAKFQAICQTYRSGLPGKIDRLRACWAAAQLEPGVGENWDELRRLVHSIAGSAGTFGLAAVGEHASIVEELLVAERESPSGDAVVEIGRQLGALVALIERTTGSP